MHIPTYPLIRSRPYPVSVRHYVPGGREDGGGIGRLIGYIVDAQSDPATHKVQDTRGPVWHVWHSAWRLAASITALVADRVAHPARIQHIHIAGRGSTARKIILCAVARTIGSVHLLHLHDFDYAADVLRRPRWQQAAIARMFKGANLVVVLGNRDRDTVADLLDVPADRIAIMRNCVPDPGQARQQDNGPKPCRIIFLGQLGPRKGVPELLAALAHPAMQNGDWQAVLAGGGPVDDYRAQADRLGLGDRVTMPGWLTEADTRALCASADILVLPSHGEGMAMAVLEGLAHGLAVVTTNVGAHGDVLEHDKSCVFVPVADPNALAASLATLVADPVERRRIAAGGRALYLSQMDIRAYVHRLAEIHDHLVADRYVRGSAA